MNDFGGDTDDPTEDASEKADKKEAFRQAFLDDQKRNRDGNHGNRWSMSTYRIALSIYTRSPASYDALRSWRLLNLPSRSSLKKFTGAHLQKPGPYYDFIKEQKTYYEKFKQDVIEKGGKEPNGEGVLILDEVKLIGKVIWNSKNGEICGLAMEKDDIVSLGDLSSELNESEDVGTQPAEYVLQFLWRDLSSNFDVIGPHYTSDATMTSAFTTACLMDTLHAFQVFKFKVVAVVLDGASTNLAMVKFLSDYGKGAYGLQPHQAGVDHHAVEPWFEHPYLPDQKIYFVICPTHQLKNMINQLFASQEGGAKGFLKNADGPTFGWKQVVDMWEREKYRRDNKMIRIVPGLVQSYIERDSWSKLNVKPAKIIKAPFWQNFSVTQILIVEFNPMIMQQSLQLMNT